MAYLEWDILKTGDSACTSRAASSSEKPSKRFPWLVIGKSVRGTLAAAPWSWVIFRAKETGLTKVPWKNQLCLRGIEVEKPGTRNDSQRFQHRQTRKDKSE